MRIQKLVRLSVASLTVGAAGCTDRPLSDQESVAPVRADTTAAEATIAPAPPASDDGRLRFIPQSRVAPRWRTDERSMASRVRVID